MCWQHADITQMSAASASSGPWILIRPGSHGCFCSSDCSLFHLALYLSHSFSFYPPLYPSALVSKPFLLSLVSLSFLSLCLYPFRLPYSLTMSFSWCLSASRFISTVSKTLFPCLYLSPTVSKTLCPCLLFLYLFPSTLSATPLSDSLNIYPLFLNFPRSPTFYWLQSQIRP